MWKLEEGKLELPSAFSPVLFEGSIKESPNLRPCGVENCLVSSKAPEMFSINRFFFLRASGMFSSGFSGMQSISWKKLRVIFINQYTPNIISIFQEVSNII